MEWYYEKIDENYDVKKCPVNDLKGEVTGKPIMGLKAWFDENPDERMRLGFVKHIRHDGEPGVDYNQQTQYVLKSIREIDEYTVEDVIHVHDKTEEQMLLEELDANPFRRSIFDFL